MSTLKRPVQYNGQAGLEGVKLTLMDPLNAESERKEGQITNTEKSVGSNLEASNSLTVQLYSHIKNQKKFENIRNCKVSRAELQRLKFRQKNSASSPSHSSEVGCDALWTRNSCVSSKLI